MATSTNGAMREIFGYKIDIMNELGRGAFGTVYKGYGENNTMVAVKIIRTGTAQDRRNASREALKFQDLKNKDLQVNGHIMTIFDVKYQQNAIYIIMELCDLGDLNQFFRNHHAGLNTCAKMELMEQIIDGIAFLHSRDIVHRDIKPANILLTSIIGSHAVVKLGDFGLTKILDPNSLTSGMSSNVGSLAFKAPEFFNNTSENQGKIRYRRNIDVYAAGLTFLAMLQARERKDLLPKAEGSLYSGEKCISVGLAAYNRSVNEQPEITVVGNSASDSVMTKRIKDIIRGMTCLSPTHRFSASEVHEMFQKFQEPVLERCATLELRSLEDVVCLINGCLVRRDKYMAPGYSGYKVTVSPIDTESPSTEWPASCGHYISPGQLAACKMAGAPGKVLLAEACPHPSCMMIRINDLENGSSTTVCQNVISHKICTGPGSSLLVCDSAAKRILHLASAPDFRNFCCAHVLKLDFLPVQGMCYSIHSNAVVFSKHHCKEVFAINLTTGNKLWQMSHFAGIHTELNPEDVCSTPQGWIVVANRRNLLFLRASNGDLVSVQPLDDVTDTDGAKPRKRQRRIPDPPSATEPGLWTKLPSTTLSHVSNYSENISLTPMVWSPSATMASSQEYCPSEDHLEQGAVNEVMCTKNDSGTKLAVRYRDGTILAYNIMSIADGRVVLDIF